MEMKNLVVRCPRHRVRPGGKHRLDSFITPDEPAIMNKAIEIIAKRASELGKTTLTRDEILEVCFDFVSLEIEYVSDWENLGYREYWLFPRETLEGGQDDCEGTAFLLASLLLASGFEGKDVRVALGALRGTGHAWTEAMFNGDWHILETTSDERLEIGKNAWEKDEGYERAGYLLELYVYRHGCMVLPGERGLYDHLRLLYGFRGLW